ncbi:hypothetical protein QFC21_001061 [Naganishia friedmannii]|uniref:Uncharacterized protein n=1 Tax=Naganishia friedmannii TaxID=89922 RepID=A0ACC2W7I8_9TREE|nr:hypothetical protein QFC21_001061 [Naganishia friedmannii]
MSSSDPTHARSTSNSSSSTLADATHPMPDAITTNGGSVPSSAPSAAHGQKAWMESDKEQAELPYNNFYLVMPALMLVLFLAALDQTIVSTALPTIAEKFHATSSQYSWVGTSYLLASTIMTPLWGRVTDIVGRKYILYPGIVVFAVGSALCGASQSMNMLIASRALQGIGGGAIMSLTQIIIGDIVPLAKRGIYNSFFGAVWGISSCVGPVLGGILAQHGNNWRWCFFLNLPTAGIALAALYFSLNLNPTRKNTWSMLARTFDFLGLALIMSGCACLVVGFSFASDHGWGDKATIALLVVGGVLFASSLVNFLVTKRNAIIPPRVLKTRTTVFLMLASLLQATAFLASSFYWPVFFQGVLGASPLMSGFLLLGIPLAVLPHGLVGDHRLRIVRPVLWVGYAIAVLGYGLAIKYVAYGQSVGSQMVILIIAGLGVGLSLAVPLIMIQAAMPLKEMAASTSSWLLTRSLGGTLGIAVFQSVISSGLQSRFPKLEGYGTMFGIPRDLSGYKQIHDLPLGSIRDGAITAFSHSLRLCYIIWTPMFAGSLLLALFTKHYTLNRLPGQAIKSSAESDVEKGAVEDGDKNDDSDILDNVIDRSKSVASQEQEQENLEAGVVPSQPELPLKPAMNV